MKVCPNCHKHVEDAALYCPECHAAIPMDVPSTKKGLSKKVGITALVVLSLAAGILCGRSLFPVTISAYEQNIQTARRYLKKESYEKAEECYQAAMEIKPAEPEPYVRLIRIYTALGQPDKAYDVIAKAEENVSSVGLEEIHTVTEEVRKPLQTQKIALAADQQPALENMNAWPIDYADIGWVVAIGDKYRIYSPEGEWLVEPVYETVTFSSPFDTKEPAKMGAVLLSASGRDMVTLSPDGIHIAPGGVGGLGPYTHIDTDGYIYQDIVSNISYPDVTESVYEILSVIIDQNPSAHYIWSRKLNQLYGPYSNNEHEVYYPYLWSESVSDEYPHYGIGFDMSTHLNHLFYEQQEDGTYSIYADYGASFC